MYLQNALSFLLPIAVCWFFFVVRCAVLCALWFCLADDGHDAPFTCFHIEKNNEMAGEFYEITLKQSNTLLPE